MTSETPNDLKARVKETYDALANEYATQYTESNEPLRLGFLRRLVEQIGVGEQEKASLLELGCGSGVPATKFMLEIEKPLFKVTGNDISTSQLNLARTSLAKYADRLELVEADMLSLSFADNAFDAVSAFYSIIHLPREEQTQLVAKIQKWLKPGGFLLANFSTENFATGEEQKWMDHEKGWMFWSSWGEEGSIKMVEDAGFELLSKEVHTDADAGRFVWLLAKKV